jgi:branched-chain amino acid transport system substrate-binding protein
MAQSPEADGAIAISLFQEHPPFTANFGAADLVRIYHEKAQAAGLPYPLVDVQAATSYSAWQVLEAAVKATKSFDDATLAKWLKTNKVDTVSGKLRWDGEFNYGDDLMKIAQVQNRRWVMVYPKNLAAPGVKLQVK